MKLCFVTVGATASFNLLIQAILEQSFLRELRAHGYTNLLIQYGKDGKSLFDEFLQQYPPGSEGHHGLVIDGFDFNSDGLDHEMRLAKAWPSEGRLGGLIISHAGSGSIMDALRLGVPLMVVPNPTLKDNHQQELADILQEQGYLISSHYQEIASSLDRAERLRAQMAQWPPVSRAQEVPPPSLEQVMSDELGFLD
ncbi:N-acetylglucosaminyldiphosphodolichol N-acetylglucosaminyltransferase catalytic subunit ALG13 [Aspergillus saccharolyticus JOP 1030-1]|uniref:UDP-N-acetylglucosamine transferase subunit ALG13 n=1 Tax=Aspergillus saccharolyticus JOP 1030-1 TaxID=1450539 RepID=A0A318ZH32_9EURO|nr:family 28 putative glycosyltransferase [Aspergillus saccharolyticus JOP 1030-1]PYH46779.1 family 28 putative glycosyltransferase [Aspergillus saccharolyticus JOP 1030-1]